MNIRLKVLFEFKNTLKKALEQLWTDPTRKEIEARIKDIDDEIERVRKVYLVAP